jgi:hypothetical protein
MHDVFETYLHALRQDRDDKTELWDRSALESACRSRYAEFLRIDCSIRLTALPSIDGVGHKTLK